MAYEIVDISDRLVKLKWEIQQYVRTDKGDIPKKNDHLIDAWRYLNATANYDMNEVFEKQKEKGERRAFTMKDDIASLEREMDWTTGLIPWED